MNYSQYTRQKLEQIRTQKNLSKEEFADLLVLPIDTYLALEKGEVEITPILLLQIAHLLNINLTEFNKDFQIIYTKINIHTHKVEYGL